VTAVTYVATRSVTGAHVAGNTYSLDLPCLIATPGDSRQPNVVTNEALSGARETFRFHAIKSYDIQLLPLTGTKLAQVLEFLDSVEAGESFQFDMYGSVATPVAPVAASLETAGYTQTRYQSVGQGGANDYFTMNFKVRTVIA